MEFTASVLASLVAGIVLGVLGLLIFDLDKLKTRFNKVWPFSIYYSFERLNSRTQVLKNFKELFIEYRYQHGGKILLMSNTGGFPEYDPYVRIMELTTNSNIEIYVSVTRVSFKDYYSQFPATAIQVINNSKVKLYLFDNLTPYRFRIGLNTDLGIAFFCGYHGHNQNKVNLEGIKSNNPVLLEAIENLYIGLLSKGTEIDSSNYQTIL